IPPANSSHVFSRYVIVDYGWITSAIEASLFGQLPAIPQTRKSKSQQDSHRGSTAQAPTSRNARFDAKFEHADKETGHKKRATP
ncbi:hypothetical protein, partial [Burkholderia multivorans]